MVNIVRSMSVADALWDAFLPAARSIIIRLAAWVTSLEGEKARLEEEKVQLAGEIARLHERNEELEAQQHRNSTNSSKPPSTDRPKRQKGKGKSGKPKGGVPGHPAHFRELAPPERVNRFVPHYPTSCDGCGETLSPAMVVGEPMRHQIWELPPVLTVITEHQRLGCLCPRCQTTTRAQLPASVPSFAFGPRFTAFVALIVGRFRLSRQEASQLVGALTDTTIAPSTVVKLCERASEALKAPAAAIQAEVQASPVAYVDETSFSRGGVLTWLWAAVTATATAFHISDHRSQAARKELMGPNYPGIVVSDRAKAYNDIPAWDRGLCHAHLKRNLVAVIERGGRIGHVAQLVRNEQKRMFVLYHARERGELDQAQVLEKLRPIKARLGKLLKARIARQQPPFKDMSRLWLALFTFVEVTGVEGTSNKVERVPRPAVIWRRTCFGTDSVAGDRFVERMLSVSATCCQRRINLFSYLCDAVNAHFKGLQTVLVPRAP